MQTVNIFCHDTILYHYCLCKIVSRQIPEHNLGHGMWIGPSGKTMKLWELYHAYLNGSKVVAYLLYPNLLLSPLVMSKFSPNN